MPVIRIRDLAEVMIEEMGPRYGKDPANIRIDIIGVKPGEKMYEELMNHEETRRAIELERYFVVIPAFRRVFRSIDYRYPKTISQQVTNPYNSSVESPLTTGRLREFLIGNQLLEEDPAEREHPAERFWPNG